MIRCLALTFALSAAIVAPVNRNGSTVGRSTVRDSNARHLTAIQHTVAHSGYIIASS
jgi:hypothetical protein